MSEYDSRSESQALTGPARALVRRVTAVRDAGMRKRAVAEFVAALPEERAVDTLVNLVRGAAVGADAGCIVALDSLTSALCDPQLVPYATRARLYQAAKETGHREIACLFFDASPPVAEHATGVDPARDVERPIRPRGRALTLGERKSLARSHRRDLLRVLMRDPHPEVIRVLAGNPRVTERDVVQISSLRPCAPETLAILACHPRWCVRYPVKRALAYNPHTPVHVAVRLLTTLRQRDLRAVVEDRSLARAVRQQARDLLERRSV